MDEETIKRLKYLRLSGLLAHWDEYLTLARKQGFSPVRLLQYVLEQECQIKSENARRLRLQRARIPDPYVMETFPFSRQPTLDKKRILSLYDAFDYLAKSQNIIWVGPTGCGKTGLATSFLIQTIHRGYTGRFVLFADLVTELFKSVAAHSEQEVLKRYVSYDCLLIDEVGYLAYDNHAADLLFQIVSRRYERRSIVLTTNLVFADWNTAFPNAACATALIDRLTHHAEVLVIKGKSYRIREAELAQEARRRGRRTQA